MNNKQVDKTLSAHTAKELFNLIRGKEKHLRNRHIFVSSIKNEIILHNLWKEMLGHSAFGVDDDFFKVGGNSLKAIQLLSRISSHFLVDLPFTDIFLQPTINKIAALISQKQNELSSLSSFIAAREQTENIPLSFEQERLWFIDKLQGSVAYHLSSVIRLKGRLNKNVLELALQSLINRHEILRTIVVEDMGSNYQSVKEKDGWKLSFTDGTAFNTPATLHKRIRQFTDVPFNLSDDYMLRANLIRLNDDEHVLVITVHHIASDGWSLSIIVNELVTLYNALLTGGVAQLAPLDLQYADYAIWQRRYLQGARLDFKLQYWKEKLKGVSILQLPTDYPRPKVQSTSGASVEFNINRELTTQIQMFSAREGVTLFMTLLAAFKVLMNRYSQQNDICVGTPIAGRQQKEVEGLIGLFVNTMALRTQINDDTSFTDFLAAVKNTTLEAFDHYEVPFEKVVAALVQERNLGWSPLFQVMFVLQNKFDMWEMKLSELTFTEESVKNNTSKFDLTFNMVETDNGMSGIVTYSTALYNEDTIARMVGHFTRLLSSVVKEPGKKIGVFPLLSADEEQQLLVHFNNSEVAYPKNKTIVNLFEEQVAKHPQQPAVVYELGQLTYRELNERSNSLAHYLKTKGVTEESFVAVNIERSPDMIVAIMGILKAGGTFVPIDEDYPLERIKYILEDTKASAMVCNLASRMKLQTEQDLAITVITIDEEWPVISTQPVFNPQAFTQPDQLAYVIYTSGSTGRPKGVMTEHAALMDHCYGLIKSAELNVCSSFTFFAPLVFDAGHSILFTSFLLGASLHVLSNTLLQNGKKLFDYLNDHSIDCIKILPSLWLGYTDGEKLILPKKVIIFGGEELSKNIPALLLKSDYKGAVYNHYGPTEATIGKCIFKVDLTRSYHNIPIGKPFSNTQLYILDQHIHLVPIGVAGELYIAGDGLARGYLNMPELTAEKFVNNPFSINGEAKMYSTGDYARWLPDGNIEYFGRIDDQVKIRGFRVEPGEIETALQQSGLVEQVVVVAKEIHQFNKQLVAYIIPRGPFDKEKIINYLKTRLPAHMVPAGFVVLERFPFTPNGKINRKALPDADYSRLSVNEYAPPGNEVERVLVGIWEELLGVERIGINDNFFELGGHSLLIIRMVALIRKKLSFTIPFLLLFQLTTISDISRYLDWEQRSKIEEDTSELEIINI